MEAASMEEEMIAPVRAKLKNLPKPSKHRTHIDRAKLSNHYLNIESQLQKLQDKAAASIEKLKRAVGRP